MLYYYLCGNEYPDELKESCDRVFPENGLPFKWYYKVAMFIFIICFMCVAWMSGASDSAWQGGILVVILCFFSPLVLPAVFIYGHLKKKMRMIDHLLLKYFYLFRGYKTSSYAFTLSAPYNIELTLNKAVIDGKLHIYLFMDGSRDMLLEVVKHGILDKAQIILSDYKSDWFFYATIHNSDIKEIHDATGLCGLYFATSKKEVVDDVDYAMAYNARIKLGLKAIEATRRI